MFYTYRKIIPELSEEIILEYRLKRDIEIKNQDQSNDFINYINSLEKLNQDLFSRINRDFSVIQSLSKKKHLSEIILAIEDITFKDELSNLGNNYDKATKYFLNYEDKAEHYYNKFILEKSPKKNLLSCKSYVTDSPSFEKSESQNLFKSILIKELKNSMKGDCATCQYSSFSEDKMLVVKMEDMPDNYEVFNNGERKDITLHEAIEIVIYYKKLTEVILVYSEDKSILQKVHSSVAKAFYNVENIVFDSKKISLEIFIIDFLKNGKIIVKIPQNNKIERLSLKSLYLSKGTYGIQVNFPIGDIMLDSYDSNVKNALENGLYVRLDENLEKLSNYSVTSVELVAIYWHNITKKNEKRTFSISNKNGLNIDRKEDIDKDILELLEFNKFL